MKDDFSTSTLLILKTKFKEAWLTYETFTTIRLPHAYSFSNITYAIP